MPTIADINLKIDGLQKQKDGLNKQVDPLRKQIAQLRTQKEAVKNNDQQVAMLDKKIADLLVKVANLNGKDAGIIPAISEDIEKEVDEDVAGITADSALGDIKNRPMSIPLPTVKRLDIPKYKKMTKSVYKFIDGK